ncbi:MAG: N-acetylmuramic acid 6-phosphate etherase [Planctomycetaceae bacterium]|nr:N-acetylmuramic acid 6-phosphate etherase [Planctomycetaceae bacterium]
MDQASDGMATELSNEDSKTIDTMDCLAIVDLINREDQTVALAVGTQRVAIAAAMDAIANALAAGGRLIYVGAGTSGRLAVLDAAECPPTFSVSPETVVGIIAGGPAALTSALEGAEDDEAAAVFELKRIQLQPIDILVGIATSGRTPFVLSAIRYAASLAVPTIGITCNPATPLHDLADVTIAPIVGPEVITGSTRMKAGTATKMVLNMLTTGAMIRLGKTYGNLMVDLRATNTKLRQRCVRIVRTLTGLDEQAAQELLEQANGQVKTAIVAHRCRLSIAEARRKLRATFGHLRNALEQ